jgi:hypothetical protein
LSLSFPLIVCGLIAVIICGAVTMLFVNRVP